MQDGAAAYGGNLQMFDWLKQNGAPLDANSFDEFVKVGNIEVMEWCLQNGCVLKGDHIFSSAAKSGKIGTLEWLKLKYCGWGVLTVEFARSFANCDVITWLQENKCPKMN